MAFANFEKCIVEVYSTSFLAGNISKYFTLDCIIQLFFLELSNFNQKRKLYQKKSDNLS